jgi:hypothetical protein
MDIELSNTVAGNIAADIVRLFRRKIAGRNFPVFKDSSGVEEIIQGHIAYGSFVIWTPVPNSTTTSSIGLLTPTVLGTNTARTMTFVSFAARLRRLGYVSVVTAGGFCGHYSIFAQYVIGNGAGLGGFHYVCRFSPSDAATVAGARMFVGLRSIVTAPTNVEPSTLTNHVGIVVQSSSTTLSVMCSGSTVQTPIDLGTDFPVGLAGATQEAYTLTLFASPNDTFINWRVERNGTNFVSEGVFNGSTGVAVPGATTLLAHAAWRCNNATALACSLDILGIYVKSQ